MRVIYIGIFFQQNNKASVPPAWPLLTCLQVFSILIFKVSWILESQRILKIPMPIYYSLKFRFNGVR